MYIYLSTSEPEPKPQPTTTPSNTSLAATNSSKVESDISIDVTDYSSMADNSDDKLSQSRSRATSVARWRPREKRKATGINFVVCTLYMYVSSGCTWRCVLNINNTPYCSSQD